MGAHRTIGVWHVPGHVVYGRCWQQRHAVWRQHLRQPFSPRGKLCRRHPWRQLVRPQELHKFEGCRVKNSLHE